MDEKKLQEALAKSEEKFRIVADNTYDWEYWRRPDGIFEYCSPSCKRVTGHAPEDFMHDKEMLERIIFPEDRPAWLSHNEETLKYKLPSACEFRIIRLDGEIRWIFHVCQSVFDTAGNLLGIRASNRDITERKKMENALRLANAYNRSLIEAALDPLVTIGYEGRIMDVNNATEAATGYSRKELIGRDFSDYFTDPEEARRGYQQVFKEGFVYDYQLEIRHRDGHIIPVLYNASVYRDESGKVIGVFAAARDITERKKNEEEIRELNRGLEFKVKQRTAELTVANKVLEAFSYSVAHDLRAPLRAIAGFASILSEDYRAKLDDEGKRLMGVISDNVLRMGQLINDLLALSQLSRQEMKTADIDMSELARSVCNELKNEPFRDRAIEVSVKPLPAARADYTLTRQIFINLISNAMKFTSRKDKAFIEVGGYDKGQERVYYVKDNGAGFEMQYVDKLFGVFQRLHGHDEFSGTGIGLAIVGNAVRRHGGTVWAEGEVDKGATFYFTLPKGG